MPSRPGSRSAAQTPAPRSERIKGSSRNPPGSASGTSSQDIELSDAVIEGLTEKMRTFNEEHPGKRVSLGTLKKVFRRGAGAFSSSHRPGMTRNGWAYARVNAFLRKRGGGKAKAAYVQDDDLMAKGGEIQLLAPNGKPSNLTPEQYRLVRTPQFKAWFGDWEHDPENASKVVDENNEPLVVYHGGGTGYTQFQVQWTSSNKPQDNLGSHFGTYKAAKDRIKKSGFFRDPTKSYIYPVFLNIRKLWKDKVFSTETEMRQHIKNFILKNYPEVDASNYTYSGNSWVGKEIGREMGKKGIGVAYRNSHEDRGSISWIATKREQIKLADGSNTTFDPENPDIRYADGGQVQLLAPNGQPSNLTPEQYRLVRTPQFKAWFGDWEHDPENASKVVDMNEEPMVVYHASPYDDITIFDINRGRLAMYGPGTYFSNKAGEYKGAKNYEVFLSLKSPIIIDAKQKHLPYDTYDELYENRTIDVIIKNPKHLQNHSQNRIYYVVKHSENIKLADGSNTTFDPENPDIRYADGGQVQLLAPNGQPSNLTPEQYRLVRTLQFKAWFGDWEHDPENASKVVDMNGEPMVVYHGTRSDFNVFQIGATGGLFFSNKIDSAKRFSEGDLKRRGDKPKIISAFINSRKLLSENVIDEALITEYFLNYFAERPYISKKSQKNILNKKYNFFHYYLLTLGIVNNEPLFYVKKYGYDGLSFIADNNAISFVVFNSNQIKLADGSNTTFDPENPDIRYADGGFVGTNCREYITHNEAVLRTGYYLDLKELSSVVDPYGQVPMNLKHTLVTYDSGNQETVELIDTINPVLLQNELAKVFNIPSNNAAALVSTYIQKGKKLKAISDITGDDIVIFDRGRLVCINDPEPGMEYAKGGAVDGITKRNAIERADALRPFRVSWAGIPEGPPRTIPYRDVIPNIDKTNYWVSTDAVFTEVDYGGITPPEWWDNFSAKHPGRVKGSPLSDSRYIVFDDRVYRYSDHWGRVASCNWGLRANPDVDQEPKGKWAVGVVEYDEMRPNMDGTHRAYVLNKEFYQQTAPLYREWVRRIEELKEGPNVTASGRAMLDEYLFKIQGRMKRESMDKAYDDIDFGYAEGGEIQLLAPNGQPSNLTKEQYRLVRTPQFKAWFGDWEHDPENASKVVDENGEPLVQYHFSKKLKNEDDRFFIFRTNSELGAHFGTKQQIRYIDGIYIRDPKTKWLKVKTDDIIHTDFRYYAVFLRILNPIRLKDLGFFKPSQLSDKLEKLPNYDIEIKKNPELSWWVFDSELSKDELYKFQHEKTRVLAKNLGIDGIVYLNRAESKATWNVIDIADYKQIDDEEFKEKFKGLEDSWIAFYPEQIKLADGSNTTFDSENPDIRYAEGGTTGTEKPIMLPDTQASYEGLKPILERQGYELRRSDPSVGRLAKGMTLADLALRHGLTEADLAPELAKGIETEMEHTEDPAVAEAIAMDHIYESPDYYTKLQRMETTKYARGGTLNPDSPAVKGYFAHGSGNTGGVLVGKRHSEGGIKAINKATGQPLEMEGGEVVITRDAVSDDTRRQFEGEMLTNREILSRINESGGGVSFEDGGHVCSCSGKKYNYGGEVMEDYDIMRYMAKGGMTPEQRNGRMRSRLAALESRATDDELPNRRLSEDERWLLHKFKTGSKVVAVDAARLEMFDGLLDDRLIYFTPSVSSECQDARLTPKGVRYMGENHVQNFAHGGKTDCGCGMMKKGGETAEGKTYFKGIDHAYKNQFELNKAIEEFLEQKKGKAYTSQEKKFLSYFAGYGGLIKYGAEGEGILYEYYTPSEIARKMWALAYKYGYNGGPVLEPSVGVGEFLKYAPEDAPITAYEISPVSSEICRILFPTTKVVTASFETQFIRRNLSIKGEVKSLPKFDLVIGNPPYGEYEGFYAGMGEKAYTNAQNWIDYFILRGLDLLNPQGLLIYIIGGIGKPWLALDTKVKRKISEKCVLLDAYRLPNGLFDNTEVQTDIIVLQKR